MEATCPTNEVLEGYVRQTLPDEESDRWRPHLVGCRACQASLGRIHLEAFGRDRRRRHRAGRGGPRWMRTMVTWQVVAVVLAIGILAAGAVGVFFLIGGK